MRVCLKEAINEYLIAECSRDIPHELFPVNLVFLELRKVRDLEALLEGHNQHFCRQEILLNL
eukprot:scaffold1190_cov393-Prasinococcus_capsulatus_cf.AAC.6